MQAKALIYLPISNHRIGHKSRKSPLSQWTSHIITFAGSEKDSKFRTRPDTRNCPIKAMPSYRIMPLFVSNTISTSYTIPNLRQFEGHPTRIGTNMRIACGKNRERSNSGPI